MVKSLDETRLPCQALRAIISFGWYVDIVTCCKKWNIFESDFDHPHIALRELIQKKFLQFFWDLPKTRYHIINNMLTMC